MKNDGFDKYNEEISWPIPFGPYRKHKVSLCHFNNAFSDRVFFSRKTVSKIILKIIYGYLIVCKLSEWNFSVRRLYSQNNSSFRILNGSATCFSEYIFNRFFLLFRGFFFVIIFFIFISFLISFPSSTFKINFNVFICWRSIIINISRLFLPRVRFISFFIFIIICSIRFIIFWFSITIC